MHYLKEILTVQGMWGGVIATLVFIAVGFFATRKGIFTKEINGKLSKFGISFILPFLCIFAFMTPASTKLGSQIGIILGLSIAFYIVAAIVSTLIVKFAPNMVPKMVSRKAEELFEKSNKDGSKELFRDAAINDIKAKLTTSVLMLSYGSLQFFAYPLVIAMSGSIFSKDTLALAQVWCLPYMIAAFSYVMLQYSGEKFSKKNVKPVLKAVFSPMMIALYLSLFLWAMQFADSHQYIYSKDLRHIYVPVDPATFDATKDLPTGYAGPVQFWAGFKVMLPSLFKAIQAGVGILSPIAWIIIGGTLATSNLKKAAKSGSVWGVTALKLTLMPLIMFLIALPLVGSGNISVATGTLLTLFGATPPAAVCIIFAASSNHPKTGFTAEVSALSTLLCLVAMPIWIIIANVTFKSITNAA